MMNPINCKTADAMRTGSGFEFPKEEERTVLWISVVLAVLTLLIIFAWFQGLV